MPNIFIGHPFRERFPVERFQGIFNQLPFGVLFGDRLKTNHLLTKVKSFIRWADYCVFDLTRWNPNVMLEVGLAEGMKQRQKEYYILLNTKWSGDLPSDIKGFGRIEYESYDFNPDHGLGHHLVTQLLSKEPLVQQIWKSIPEAGDGVIKRVLALRILGDMRHRNQKIIALKDVQRLARRTGLKKSDCEDVLKALAKPGRYRFLERKSMSRRNPTYSLGKALFKRTNEPE